MNLFARKLRFIDDRNFLRAMRIFFWICGVVVGLAQTWNSRHLMLSDGLSYTQIAMAYLHGDWANAINPYWSPLYSWLLALGYAILKPAPYWEVATLHLINFLAFLGAFAGFEFFMKEVVYWKRTSLARSVPGFSDFLLYFAGYTVLLFEALAQVSAVNTSPDMIAMALTLWLATLIWRVRTRGGSALGFLLIGVLCAALFLARTAFAPCFLVVLFIVFFSLRAQGRAWFAPVFTVLLAAVILSAPFVYAISKQVGRFTIGESGRLNYAWEVNSAPRFRHWQGDPKSLGVPKHPTTLAVKNPPAFVFPEPVGGSYPPWYNPAYWYEGIHPKFEFRSQLKVILVNLSVLCLVFGRSPILVPALLLIPFCGFLLWWRRYRDLWPVTLLPLSSVALYSLIYVERRYLAANVLILWMTFLLSIPLCSDRLRTWATRFLAACCALFLFVFIGYRQIGDLRSALFDLLHGREKYPNVQYMLAQRIRQFGVRPGDRVAYIGTSDIADWVRLDDVRIVGEVPVNHSRNRSLFNNIMVDDDKNVVAFWKASKADRDKVLEAFRKVGAKIVVTDGSNPDGLASGWPCVLSDRQQQQLPKPDKKPDLRAPNQETTRYLLLGPTTSKTDG